MYLYVPELGGIIDDDGGDDDDGDDGKKSLTMDEVVARH